MRDAKEVLASEYQEDRVNWLVYKNNDVSIGVLTADILWVGFISTSFGLIRIVVI